MSAALIDLVSKGAQDVYITGEPQVSFFHQNYKRHTNFSIKPERLDYVGTFGGGNEVVVPLRTKGDLLSYIWIEATNIGATDDSPSGFFSTNDPTTTEFSLWIGGQEVTKLDSLFIQGVHNVLYKQDQAKASCAVTLDEVPENAVGVSTYADHYMIPFFFSEDWTKSLPLTALQFHQVELRIRCRAGQVVPFVPESTPKVYGTYVYLDTEEREMVVNHEHELLITQTQYQPMSASDVDVDLTYFNHPVKALHVVSSIADGTTWSTNWSFDDSTLYINGTPLFENTSAAYHHNVVPEMHCSVLAPNVLNTTSTFTWPFCLTMNKSQPTGSLNFSRIDNAKLVLNGTTNRLGAIVRTYAVNYNILRIKDGMGGVAFAN